MTLQTVTITLPETVFQRIKQRSRLARHSVAEEMVAIMIAFVDEEDALPLDLEQELSQLDALSVDDLWSAARLTASVEKEKQMQALLDKQQLEGLTFAERQEAQQLSHFFNRIMLVRAKAAVLLQERGYNIDALNQS